MTSGFSTRAIHVGQEPDELTGAVTVPLYQTSTYAQEEIGKHKGYEYARTQNPTRFAWEKNLANLEEGVAAYAFASGLATIDSVMKLLRSGDHVVMSEDMYGGTFRLFDKILRNFGIEFTSVDMRDEAAIRASVQPNTKMFYTETPTNPMMNITDIRMVSRIARQHNAMLVVDNTFATPFFQRPLSLGADIVVHSATKYLGGHSDLIHGIAVTSSPDIADQLKFIQNAAGAVPGPFECWLCLRSIKTLAVRMRQHEDNALRIAHALEHHKGLKAVHYPGLKSHPQHDLAASQMSGFGAIITLELGSLNRARAFTSALEVFTLGESLGGVESLVCHPVSMTHGSVPVEKRLKLGITEGLVRLSVGIEDEEDLLRDVELALDAVSTIE